MEKGIRIKEYKREVNVKILPEDYVNIIYNYDIEMKRLVVEILPRVPYNVSTYTKGRAGEYIVKTLLDVIHAENGNIMLWQKHGYEYDILDRVYNIRYEVKMSPLHHEDTNHASWTFYLATNKPSKEAIQISNSKYLKDYQGQCDYFVLVGMGKDGDPAVTFLIPSNDKIAKDKDNLKVPYSDRGELSRYKVDLQELCIINCNKQQDINLEEQDNKDSAMWVGNT